jgi:Protein of unknown function (DUF1559)
MSRAKWMVIALVVCLSCGLLLPSVQTAKEDEGWKRSAYSLGCAGRALRSYCEQNGGLPPAVVRAPDGRPLYGWRVLLLPYLEQDDLYKQFHLDEPWDSDHNKRLLAKTPRYYEPVGGGPDPPGLTRYQVFVGPGTAFERDGLAWEEVSNTLLVVEAAEPVPWSKPAELTYDPGRPLPPLGCPFPRPVHLFGYDLWRTPGFNACFADNGPTRFITRDTDEKTLRGLITWRTP